MWALAMLLPGLVALFLMPLALYWLYPPEIKSTPNAAQFARSKLAERGPVNRGEKIMLGVFVMLLLLAYLYAHYLFASTTAHITAMFAAFYGAGIALGEWWKAGFVMSLVLIMVWVVVGSAWWKLLGYW